MGHPLLGLLRATNTDNDEPNYNLIKCYLILLSRYLVIQNALFFSCQHICDKVLKMHTQLKNARAASGYRWSFSWIIKINT